MKISKLLLAALVLFALEKGIRTQTHGFRLEKIFGAYTPKEAWEMPESSLDESLLSQEFTFLGSGVQCYAFLGADKQTVLKVFKHHHFGLTTPQLEKLPLPPFLEKWRQNTLRKREKRVTTIFKSALLAKEKLEGETGLLHLSLNPTEEHYPLVTFYDKIGIRYCVDLNSTPFLLQKRADAFIPYLNTHPNEAKHVIDSLFAHIKARTKKGIGCSDDAPSKNFGILDGNVVQIDVGSFFESETIENSISSKRALFTQTLELKDWIKKNAPELKDDFERNLKKAIRT